jgi:imidazole glycerol-phosphate synthase subunit HisH
VIAIVDYGMGNVRSVKNAVDFLGGEAVVTADPALLDAADRIVLPGVGAFGDAMRNLEARRLPALLHAQVIEKRKPMLGICLGLELLATCSTEHGSHRGLGWVEARVTRFASDGRVRIPHMGWNEIRLETTHPVFDGIREQGDAFYFVHSFHMVCADAAHVVATSEHGVRFPAAIARGNIVATQFHPEKSQDNGLQVLRNFLRWRP